MAEADRHDTLRLRLYCHGLGDCNLIGVPRADGGTFWILIDCGIHTSAKGGPDRIREVVADIASVTKRLDVIVGTHEHWDHISGFKQADDLFDAFAVGEVWFGWTEDPGDPLARQLDRFKSDALAVLADAALRLDGDPRYGAAAEGIEAMLGFSFGAAGERTRDARERLRALSPTVRHLAPGTIAPLPAGLEAIRIYVLAPPRDVKLLGIEDSKADTYSLDVGGSPLVGALRNGMAIGDGQMSLASDPLAPFDPNDGLSLSEALAGRGDPDDPATGFLSRHYAGDAQGIAGHDGGSAPGPDQTWRRIDTDWLGPAADLALQLDSRTNNTSLVLAIEIVASGKVLVFAADAQVGNWRSWKDVTFPAPTGTTPVTGADLLARTVFYKVGHHGSRNATLSEGGLELMTSPELTAFIPTDEAMAKKVRWKDIPATKLLGKLQAKTGGRLIQSDAEWVQTGEGEPVKPGGALRAIEVEPALYVELEIG